MKVIYIAVFFSILMIGCAGSPRIPENADITMEEYSEHLTRFFENKNDTIIYETISIYKNDDNAEALDTVDSILIFFFYGIKTDNADRYNNFRRIVTDSKIERLIFIFTIIDETDMGAYNEAQDASPDLNDVFWTMYFSTGNTKYLDKLLNVVTNYYNETENANNFLTGMSAMWSLSSNMQTFPSIREYVQNSNILPNNIKQYIMNNSPGKIWADTSQFFEERRQNGIW